MRSTGGKKYHLFQAIKSKGNSLGSFAAANEANYIICCDSSVPHGVAVGQLHSFSVLADVNQKRTSVVFVPCSYFGYCAQDNII